MSKGQSYLLPTPSQHQYLTPSLEGVTKSGDFAESGAAALTYRLYLNMLKPHKPWEEQVVQTLMP